MNRQTEKSGDSAASREPTFAVFLVLLVTLWALNLADVFQTLYLKGSGFLATEANSVIDLFLNKGAVPFFLAKVLAMVLVTSMLLRGWFDKTGFKFLGVYYPPDQVRRFIIFLLMAGVIYYVIIVFLPFAALSLTGLFEPIDPASL